MRPRQRRCFDVATSLFYYLMFINIAGAHAYKVIQANPTYHAPPAEQLVAEAQAQVEHYTGQLPGKPAPAALIQTHADGRTKGLLHRLDRLEETIKQGTTAARVWDEAIYVAEELRRAGETFAKESARNTTDTQRADKVRVGWTVALRGARTQAMLARLVTGSAVPQ